MCLRTPSSFKKKKKGMHHTLGEQYIVGVVFNERVGRYLKRSQSLRPPLGAVAGSGGGSPTQS